MSITGHRKQFLHLLSEKSKIQQNKNQQNFLRKSFKSLHIRLYNIGDLYQKPMIWPVHQVNLYTCHVTAATDIYRRHLNNLKTKNDWTLALSQKYNSETKPSVGWQQKQHFANFYRTILIKITTMFCWAVVAAQLTARLLQKADNLGSNPIIGLFYWTVIYG